MKKSKISLIAVAALIIGAAASAFSTKGTAGPTSNSYFEFDYAHFSPTKTNVEDESKWVKVSDLGACNNNPTRACRIEVLPAYVSGSTLLSTANIVAMESSTNVAYVSSGNIFAIRNKP